MEKNFLYHYISINEINSNSFNETNSFTQNDGEEKKNYISKEDEKKKVKKMILLKFFFFIIFKS